MAQEIDLGGTIYISSKRAAELTGYTQDYIGQLARSGSISAQRVSGLWYVVEDSLKNYKSKADEYKPTPPPREPSADLDAAVSFDGKDYISAQRAAKITGYNQDYVSQLARSNKVISRQIGNRWYVDREGIVAHKKHNDSLLAAVQAESVGLGQPSEATSVEESKIEEGSLHYTYVKDEKADILPSIPDREPEQETEENAVKDAENTHMAMDEISEREEANEIPIRVIPERQTTPASRPSQQVTYPNARAEIAPKNVTSRRSNTKMAVAVVALIVLLFTGGTAYLMLSNRPVNGVLVGQSTGTNGPTSVSASEVGGGSASGLAGSLRGIFSKELYYKRAPQR